MRLCLALGPSRSWEEIRTLATAAQGAGWDALRCSDPPGPATECFALAGALSQIIGLEIQVVVDQARARHPAVVAKEAATLDVLCGGRLLLGLRPLREGGGEAELTDSVAVIRALVAGGPADLSEGRYRLIDAPFDPVPLRQPFPILVVGGSAALAARLADHWSVIAAPEEVGAVSAALTQALRVSPPAADPADVIGDHPRDGASAGSNPTGATLGVSVPAGTRLERGVMAAYRAAGVEELVVGDDRLGAADSQWADQLSTVRAVADTS